MVARRSRWVAATGVACCLASPAVGQEAGGEAWRDYALDVRIWLDRGTEPVLDRGERVRVYYRVSEDANVAIFRIDTDGTVHLVFPRSPRENHIVLGARDYRLLFPETSYWFVDEDPGMGYFFALASPEPLDLSAFTYSHYGGGWDLSPVSRRVYSDPYEAMDDYVSALIPGWETAIYALDVTSYHVGDAHEYPRFLCYDCHGFQPFHAWNPYYYACTSFRVVVYDDPLFYPAFRYGGTAVVQPATRARPRFVFKERAEGEPSTPLLTRRDQRGLGAGEDGRVRPGPQRVPAGEGTSERGGALSGPGDQRRPVVVPWPGRRPEADRPSIRGGAVRPRPGGARPTSVDGRSPGGSIGSGRPVLERRTPSTTTGGARRSRPPAEVGGPAAGAGRAGVTPVRPSAGASSRPSAGRPPPVASPARPAPNRPTAPARRPPRRNPSA